MSWESLDFIDMGLTEIEVVSERFSAACSEADYHRRDDIHDLLSDDDVS